MLTHVTVPVYCAVSVIAVIGVAPNTGLVTPGIAFMLITLSVGGDPGEVQPSTTMADYAKSMDGIRAFAFIFFFLNLLGISQ